MHLPHQLSASLRCLAAIWSMSIAFVSDMVTSALRTEAKCFCTVVRRNTTSRRTVMSSSLFFTRAYGFFWPSMMAACGTMPTTFDGISVSIVRLCTR